MFFVCLFLQLKEIKPKLLLDFSPYISLCWLLLLIELWALKVPNLQRLVQLFCTPIESRTDKLPAELKVRVFAGFGQGKGFGIAVVLRDQTKQGLVENLKVIIFIQTGFMTSCRHWGSLAKSCTGESSKQSRVNDKINQRAERKNNLLVYDKYQFCFLYAGFIQSSL